MEPRLRASMSRSVAVTTACCVGDRDGPPSGPGYGDPGVEVETPTGRAMGA